MAFVVCDPCIKCKYTDCVAVCPVDCFHEGPNMLVINPDECIDCGACEPECPAEAIREESEVPEKWEAFIQLNADKAEEWPLLSDQQDPPADADDYKEEEGKLARYGA